MLALGIDTSNYATSLAVVDAAKREVVCAAKRFLPVAKGEKGLRQSDALFHHTIALPVLFEELKSNIALHDIKCVCVSEKPTLQEKSYMPCFLAGVSAAKAFALARGVNLQYTTHQQGHLAAALFGAKEEKLYQNDILFFHASGGTTELMLTNRHNIVEYIGNTKDLYAGQAVDRLGVLLGYDFPAGEKISELAEKCKDEIKVKVSIKGMDCNLSGLENKCTTMLNNGREKSHIAKYCLTFIAETIVCMIKKAREVFGDMTVLCAGGVMCSEIIRAHVLKNLNDVYFTPPWLSADNAVGVALIGANLTNGIQTKSKQENEGS